VSIAVLSEIGDNEPLCWLGDTEPRSAFFLKQFWAKFMQHL